MVDIGLFSPGLVGKKKKGDFLGSLSGITGEIPSQRISLPQQEESEVPPLLVPLPNELPPQQRVPTPPPILGTTTPSATITNPTQPPVSASQIQINKNTQLPPPNRLRLILSNSYEATIPEFWKTTFPSYFTKLFARELTNLLIIHGEGFSYTLSNLAYASWSISLIAGVVGALVEYYQPVKLLNPNDKYDKENDTYTMNRDGETTTITHYRKKRALQMGLRTAAKFFLVYMAWALGMGLMFAIAPAAPLLLTMVVVGLFTASGLYAGNTLEILVEKTFDGFLGVLKWDQVGKEIKTALLQRVVSFGPLLRGFLEGFAWSGLELIGIYPAVEALASSLGKIASTAIGMAADIAVISFVVSTAFSVGAFIHHALNNALNSNQDIKEYEEFKKEVNELIQETNKYFKELASGNTNTVDNASSDVSTEPQQHSQKGSELESRTMAFFKKSTKFKNDEQDVKKLLKLKWAKGNNKSNDITKSNLGFFAVKTTRTDKWLQENKTKQIENAHHEISTKLKSRGFSAAAA